MGQQSKHTMGPWEAVKADRGFIVTAKDGSYDVAIVRNIGNEDNEANATLIAAAPELLAALIGLRESGALREYLGDDSQAINTKAYARAAIAKAQG